MRRFVSSGMVSEVGVRLITIETVAGERPRCAARRLKLIGCLGVPSAGTAGGASFRLDMPEIFAHLGGTRKREPTKNRVSAGPAAWYASAELNRLSFVTLG